MEKLMFLLLGIALISCNPSSKTSEGTEPIKKDTSTLAKPEVELLEEDFPSFFQKFQSDSLFQIGRIVFPLERLISNYDGESTEQIAQKDWQYLNFDPNEDGIDAFKIQEEVQQEEAQIILKGIDNGIYVRFQFKRRGGKWQLVKWIDESA